MATVTYDYPSNRELMEIEQDLMPRLEEGRLAFELMPRENADAVILEWEQMDNFTGLQQLRGVDGSPSRVKHTGSKRFRCDPGYYGDYSVITEKDLTERRKLGSYGTPIDISDLVGIAQRHELLRELDRIELIIWTLLTTGTFSVSSPTGGVLHTDTFPIKTATASPAFTDLVNSTPLKFLRTVQLEQRGQSAAFNRSAKVYFNKGTVNNILNNTNADDIGGRYRIGGGDTLNNLEDVNKILSANDLPQIVEYDAGYLNDAGTFTTFIPDGKGVLVGQRPAGQKIGAYRLTRNANNPNLEPGSYTKIIDTGDQSVPRQVQVHRGHNGGTVLWYPGAVVALNV